MLVYGEKSHGVSERARLPGEVVVVNNVKLWYHLGTPNDYILSFM